MLVKAIWGKYDIVAYCVCVC